MSVNKLCTLFCVAIIFGTCEAFKFYFSAQTGNYSTNSSSDDATEEPDWELENNSTEDYEFSTDNSTENFTSFQDDSGDTPGFFLHVEPYESLTKPKETPSGVSAGIDFSNDYQLEKIGMGMFSMNTVNSSLRCGDVLKASSGGIFYKPFEAVLENERCVWTIAEPTANGYKINVQYLGKNAEERLSIGGIKRDGKPKFVTPSETGEFTMSDVNVLIITFHTGQLSSSGEIDTGFVLEYSTLRGPFSDSVSANSKHYIFPLPKLHFQYPQNSKADNRSYYDNLELSTFIWVPSNNLFKESSMTSLIFTKRGLQCHLCGDFLSVYFFNATSTSPGKWDYQGTICGEVEAQMMRNDDMTLVVFDSDDIGQHTGFQFTYI